MQASGYLTHAFKIYVAHNIREKSWMCWSH